MIGPGMPVAWYTRPVMTTNRRRTMIRRILASGCRRPACWVAAARRRRGRTNCAPHTCIATPSCGGDRPGDYLPARSSAPSSRGAQPGSSTINGVFGTTTSRLPSGRHRRGATDGSQDFSLVTRLPPLAPCGPYRYGVRPRSAGLITPGGQHGEDQSRPAHWSATCAGTVRELTTDVGGKVVQRWAAVSGALVEGVTAITGTDAATDAHRNAPGRNSLRQPAGSAERRARYRQFRGRGPATTPTPATPRLRRQHSSTTTATSVPTRRC